VSVRSTVVLMDKITSLVFLRESKSYRFEVTFSFINLQERNMVNFNFRVTMLNSIGHIQYYLQIKIMGLYWVFLILI